MVKQQINHRQNTNGGEEPKKIFLVYLFPFHEFGHCSITWQTCLLTSRTTTDTFWFGTHKLLHTNSLSLPLLSNTDNRVNSSNNFKFLSTLPASHLL